MPIDARSARHTRPACPAAVAPLARAALTALAAIAVAACSGGGGATATTPGDASADGAHVDAGRADAAVDAPADHAPPPDVFVPARQPGQRLPLSAACDPVDPLRCLLPWPSNTFTVVDTTTATGLRVAVSQTSVAATDDPTSINRADGFSRVTPIMTAFTGSIDATTLGDLTTGGVRLLVEQPGSTFGQAVPLRFDIVSNGDMVNPQTMVVAYPRVPLAPATDYAVVVTDAIKLVGGTPLAADRNAQVALGLAPPETEAEGALFAYDAPARAAMVAAGLDPKRAVRVWDFTTRSLAQPTVEVLAMRDAERAAFDSAFPAPPADAGVDASPSGDAAVADAAPDAPGSGGGVGLSIDSVSTTEGGSVAIAVLGRITGVPSYLTATGSLSRDAKGAPLAVGVHDVPFRAAIPVGTSDYRIVMYGHGTGGTYDETSFDAEITANGATKVGTQFIGWTSSTIANTFGIFNNILAGSEISSAGLMQSLADTMLVQHAMGSALGVALGASTLAGTSNPAAGRVPDPTLPVWAGGSLGGTMGLVYSSGEPSIVASVLNVPGAAWSQFVTYSTLFSIVRLVMQPNYPTAIDVSLGVATSQINFDPIDGATWVDAVGDHHPILLEQESMGDPVLPNIGNEMVAASTGADQVGVVLNPIVGATVVPEVTNHSGMTQYKVPKTVTDALQIHGFAAGSSPAGLAAQQQIKAFIGSVWAGTPTITIPPGCVANTPANSCDFSGS